MAEEFEAEIVRQVTSALEAGNRILAIKHVREATGKDLRAAKTFVDELSARLIAEDPEKYARLKAASTGCGAAAVLLCTAVGILLFSIV